MATTAEHAASITARIDRLPECRAVWLPIVLVSAVGIFEAYDLDETAYLPIGLVSGGALIVWWMRRALPESARWLAQQGRATEVNRLIEMLEAKVIAQCGALASPLPLPPETPRRVAFAEIWRKPYRRITVMPMVFNFFQTIGFFGFTNWLPTLLEAQGHSITRSLAYSFANARSGRGFGPSRSPTASSANG